MSENKNKLTREEKTKTEEIARLIALLPEKEQEKIYYVIKGIELAGAKKS